MGDSFCWRAAKRFQEPFSPLALTFGEASVELSRFESVLNRHQHPVSCGHTILHLPILNEIA